MNLFTPYWKRYAKRFPFEFDWFTSRWIKQGLLTKDFRQRFENYNP